MFTRVSLLVLLNSCAMQAQFFERLPQEMLIEVLYFASRKAEGIENLSYTSKHLQTKINDENFTQQLAKKIMQSDFLPEPDALILIHTAAARRMLPKALEQNGEYRLFCDVKKLEKLARQEELNWQDTYAAHCTMKEPGLYTYSTPQFLQIVTPWNITISLIEFTSFHNPEKQCFFVRHLTVNYRKYLQNAVSSDQTVSIWSNDHSHPFSQRPLSELKKYFADKFLHTCLKQNQLLLPLFHKITAIQNEKVAELSIGQLPKYRSKVIWDTLQKMYDLKKGK